MVTKRGNKGIRNWGMCQGLQIGERGITNRGSLRDFISGQKEYKLEQGFQIGAKRFQIWAEITNRRKTDYKPGHGFQTGVRIRNWCRARTASLKYSPNIFLLTNCPIKRTVSQAVRQADLRTRDMNRVKCRLQQLRRVML